MMKKIIRTTILFVTLASMSAGLTGCSTNPATGKQQFTALMSPAQENQVGANEHQKIAAQFGFYESPRVVNYVREIGRNIVPHTERADVKYNFYVLDSPIVNAFALPGGYVYISRGILSLANNEAELAAVLAHEVGHITGRHSAERYSRSAVTSLGANILSVALDSGAAAQALGLGANLYLSSYSRSQETEADSLGLRYLTKTGYQPDGMAQFLSSLQAQSGLDARLAGQKGKQGFNYLSTHPATSQRVNATLAAADSYPQTGKWGRNTHFSIINGMTYGDSESQGFVKGNSFYHTQLGFGFDVPEGYKIQNTPTQVVAASKANGAAIIFDMAPNKGRLDSETFLKQIWMKGEKVQGLESITVNGMRAATAMFAGRVNGKPSSIRLLAIEFEPERFARFQIAIPQGSSAAITNDLKRASYSFRRLSTAEKSSLRPQRIKIVTARAGDTAASLSDKMPFKSYLREDRFRVLNALVPGEALKVGRQYKTIVQ